MDVLFDYVPQPRQRLLHEAFADQILYGGAAGGGKSHAGRWDVYDFCGTLPGFRAVVFRRTGPQLEKNHVEAIRADIPRTLGSYNETRKTFYWGNGSTTVFKHLEHEHDVDDIQGWEIHYAFVDEAQQCTEYQLEYIRSRIRIPENLFEEWRKLGFKEYVDRLPRYLMTANPGGVSHQYLKDKFISPFPAETVFYDSETRDIDDPEDKGATTIFIPAQLDDNKYLGKEYRRQFSGLPEWQREMLRYGNWDVVPGAFFECWNHENIVRPFEIPKRWNRWFSCDWGFATPFWIGEWVLSDGSVKGIPDSALICVWEWYGCEKGKRNVGLRMDASDVARTILKSRGNHSGPADPSMWRTDSGPSAAEKAYYAGLTFFKADNQREAGWQEMYERIRKNLLLSFSTNRYLNRCIPSLRADPLKPEDVLKEGEDHPGDGARYMCMARPMKHETPKPKRPSDDPIRFMDLVPRERPERRWI